MGRASSPSGVLSGWVCRSKGTPRKPHAGEIMIRFKNKAPFTFVVLVAMNACVDRAEPATEMTESATPVDQRTPGGMGSPASMNGPGGHAGTYMMGDMTAHMHAMNGMRADSLQGRMPMHRERVDSMLVQMNRDMSARNMTDARWNAAVDSIRSDVTRMPGMSAGELEPFMSEHHDRVMRMMETHRTMTSGAGN